MKLYWVDAFTSRPFTGNPAAVVPLASWPDDSRLQQVAFENGLSDTAYCVRTGPGRFHLRWFTPMLEVDLCGHATLATAHALLTEAGEPGSRLVFDTRSGPLAALSSAWASTSKSRPWRVRPCTQTTAWAASAGPHCQ